MQLILSLSIFAIALIIVWFMQGYNTFIRLNALVNEGWSGIDIQLKRRYDLIPNLIATVKEYSIHEKGILENVSKMRAESMRTQNIEKKAAAEAGLTTALRSLFAVSESYPELKANTNFMQLQQELSKLEEELQLARRYYNGTARNFNIQRLSFPSNIIAILASFEEKPYFTLSSEEEKNAPSIKF